jgi:hypothetical protein
MIKMLNDILQAKSKKVKQYLPSPFPSYRLVLKEDAWSSAKKAKGWKTYEDGAKAMGLTRQSIQMADKTRVQVGPDFLCRWAAVMGNINGNWWIHFEIIPHGVVHRNHPKWNQAKNMGEIPYEPYSVAALEKQNDYPVEKKI